MSKSTEWRKTNIVREHQSGFTYTERKRMASYINIGYSVILIGCANPKALIQQLLHYKCEAQVQRFTSEAEDLFLFKKL